MLQTAAAVDSGTEPASQRLEELLPIRLLTESASGNQPLRPSATKHPSETAEPTSLSRSERENVVQASPRHELGVLVSEACNSLRVLKATVLARAGCGKTARPVR